MAWQRARAAAGELVFRNEDLDYQRCKPDFVSAMYEDLRWLGLDWDEGPDLTPLSGKSGQPGDPDLSRRRPGPRAGVSGRTRKANAAAFISPHGASCAMADLFIRAHVRAKTWNVRCLRHMKHCHCMERIGDRWPQAMRWALMTNFPTPVRAANKLATAKDYDSPAGVSWRFKVPDGETISFDDGYSGRQQFVAGQEFADFLLWRRDDIPAYQLAVVVDDAAMQITEVVRGADLLKSTARQLLLIRALGYSTPAYFHCPLLRDEKNIRLAKRHDALSLRRLREQGVKAEELRKTFAGDVQWRTGSHKENHRHQS